MAFAALAMLLSASPGHAEEDGAEPDFNRTGFYVGGGVAYATDLYEDEIEDALNTGFNVNIEDTFGVDARLGARFLRFLALELQYEWLDEYDIKVANAGGKSKVDTQTVTANLKIYIPIKRFQPYVLGGIGFQRYEIDNNYFNGTVRFKQDDYDLAGRVGLGFDIYLTEHLVFYGEGSAVLSDAKLNIPLAGSVDKLFYAGFQGGLLWRF
jgi:opacity protein-like surface antigen